MRLINLDLDPSSSEDEYEDNVLVRNPPHIQLPVPVPATFLLSTPPDATPLTATPIDWSKTPLADWEGFAIVLDNVLSPSECAQLLSLAERSAEGGRWKPALVNVNPEVQVLQRDYRNSSRILWDCEEVTERIWERCKAAPGLLGGLGRPRDFGAEWEPVGPNRRMRFLRYESGQFFRPHCDGAYSETVDGAARTSFFTLHLYLNDSATEAPASATLVGGATTFHSFDLRRSVDVHPRAGRILVFEHKGMYHSGADVTEGVKYTVRTDIMFRKVRDFLEEANAV